MLYCPISVLRRLGVTCTLDRLDSRIRIISTGGGGVPRENLHTMRGYCLAHGKCFP